MPVFAEVAPGWVLGDDQTDFLHTRPALYLFFASNRCVDIGVALEVDEVFDVVASGKAVGVGFVLVLLDSLFEFGCDSDVEVFEAACEDVDVGEFHFGEYGTPMIAIQG